MTGPATPFPTRSCARCESLPEPAEGAGRLFLWFPLGHSFGKVQASDALPGAEAREEARCLAVPLASPDLGAVLSRVAGLLSNEELRATRVFFKQGEGEPDLSDFPKVSPLDQFMAMGEAGWLVDLLAEQRLTSHFQPIVHASDTRRVFAYEALMRGHERDGQLIPPGRILGLARRADLLFQVDLAARTAAIRESVRHELRAPIFINFTPTSIYDPAFCLRTTVQAIKDAGLSPQDVVFEVIESEQVADVRHLLDIVDYYRQQGFRVALDDLGSGYSSLNLIHQLKPDIIKLDMELVRDVHKEPYKAAITEKLVQLAQTLGVRTIAEGIETEDELRWVRDRGVDYVQGFLIARPAAPPVREPPSILA